MLLEEADETIPLAPVRWEDGRCSVEEQPFIPVIFDRCHGEQFIPEGFNAVTLTLDGQWKAELKWDQIRKEATHFAQLGFKILWQIELGLFDRLPLPLSNQSQLLGLELSLKHFCQTLWKEFESVTLGLVLFRGSADFSKHLAWTQDQELACAEWTAPNLDSFEQQKTLFAADVASHYLLSLTRRLPDALPLFLLLDASQVGSLELQARLFTIERYDRIMLAIKNAQVPFAGITWEHGPFHYGWIGSQSQTETPTLTSTIGVALPSIVCRETTAYAGLEGLFQDLNSRMIPYKIIAEERLALEWIELDTFFFAPDGLSEAGKRQLRGFAAAGGTLVSLGEQLGFPGEMSYIVWQSHQKQEN